MRLLYSAVGVVGLVAGANAKAPKDLVFAAKEHDIRRRQLLTQRLCDTGAQSTIESISPVCVNVQQVMTRQTWTPCCIFDATPGVDQLCRSFETEGSYCDPTVAGQCEALGREDIIVLDLTFDALKEEDKCCKSCVCFGDPECVAFNGVLDLWIPCDGREDSCKITATQCATRVDPNGGSCRWTREDSTVAVGWDINMNGSPCVPDLSKTIAMNMYTAPNFKLDLNLGERGIIKKARFTIRNKEYTLDADDCFARPGESTSWTGNGGMPLNAIASVAADGREVSWVFFDDNSETFVKMLCVRAVTEGETGIPRINVQEVTVKATDNSGSGFCVDGTISGRTGSYIENKDLHARCIQNEATALQACKHLVDFALTQDHLEVCAAQWCSIADLDTDSCIRYMGDGKSDSRWKTKYCEAIRNNGQLGATSTSVCRSMVEKEGYNQASETWGNGGKRRDISESGCAERIASYAISDKPSCEDGVYIDANIEGTWTPLYFIPAFMPPCQDKLTVTYPEAPNLFKYSIRVRQCDVSSEPNCQAVEKCSDTVGADFQLTFTNLARSLVDLYRKGALKCSSQGDSESWCLPGSIDYESVDYCPCTDERGPTSP